MIRVSDIDHFCVSDPVTMCVCMCVCVCVCVCVWTGVVWSTFTWWTGMCGDVLGDAGIAGGSAVPPVSEFIWGTAGRGGRGKMRSLED